MDTRRSNAAVPRRAARAGLGADGLTLVLDTSGRVAAAQEAMSAALPSVLSE